MIIATEKAKEKVATILNEHSGKVLRLSIQGGGCSGFRYRFDLTETEGDDILVDAGIVTDPISAVYLEGAVLDFHDDLFSQSFVLNNPNVTTTCGCGESFGV